MRKNHLNFVLLHNIIWVLRPHTEFPFQRFSCYNYFRNNHFPNAWHKEKSGKTLILQDVRWNVLNNQLEVYVNEYPKLLKFFEECKDEIFPKVSNINIKRMEENNLNLLKPVSVTNPFLLSSFNKSVSVYPIQLLNGRNQKSCSYKLKLKCGLLFSYQAYPRQYFLLIESVSF